MLFDFQLDWQRQVFQHPDTKSVMLCLIGGQGCGKSIVYGDSCEGDGLLHNMIGRSKFYSTAQPEKYVWGQFNSLMANAYVVNLNEVGNFTHINNIYQGVGPLKSLISDQTITINDKGLSHVTAPSWHRFVYTANPKDGANIPTEDAERRYVVIRCSDELCSGASPDGVPVKDYFAKLADLVKKPILQRDFYDLLMARSVPRTFHKDDLPISSLHKQLNAANRDPIDKWLSSLEWDEEQTTKKLTNKAAWAAFQDYCNNESIPLRLSAQQFKIKLSARPFVTAYHDRNGRTDERGKAIDREGLERALPPVPEEQGTQDPEPDFKTIATDFWNQPLMAELAADPAKWKAARKAEARARKKERLVHERVRAQEREDAA